MKIAKRKMIGRNERKIKFEFLQLKTTENSKAAKKLNLNVLIL